MIQKKNGIVVVGAIFVDIKGFPQDIYVPDGRNAGYIEYIHGGVARNVVEDIANLGLNSTFVSIVDNTALGEDVKQRLQNRNVNTDYMKSIENGMGTWLAVFDHNGELAGSISHRPNLMPIYSILEENGDTIIENSDSVVAEIDMDEEIVEKVVYLCQIIYVFLTIFLYLLKCPQSLILSALRAFCFCGKPHISRSIFLYFRYQAWLKSW